MEQQGWRLIDEKGKYFRGMTRIGPRGGGTREEAAVFDARDGAAVMLGQHWAMGGYRIEEPDGTVAP